MGDETQGKEQDIQHFAGLGKKPARTPRDNWEDIAYFVDKIHEGQQTNREAGSKEREEILEEIYDLKEKEKEILELKEKVSQRDQQIESLEGELAAFRRSVPWPAYAIVVFGIISLGYSAFFTVPLVVPLLSLGFIIIGATAIIESKYYENRRRL